MKTKPPAPKDARTVRYRADPAYRAHVIASKRIRYHKQARLAGSKVRNCITKLPMIHVYGRKRAVATPEGVTRVLTYSVEELAAVIGYHHVVVRGWIRKGKFPPGPCKSAQFPFNRVFLKHHAEAIVCVMARLQQTSQYLYDSDTDVIHALFAAVK